MSENRESRNKILFIVSALVCILRYLAILLPDIPLFALCKQLEQAPQQYCLDFAVFVIFILVTAVVLKSDKTEGAVLLYWSEVMIFAAFVPMWRYIVDFWSWLETGNISDVERMAENGKGFVSIMGRFLPVLLIFLAAIVFLRCKEQGKKGLEAGIKAVQKDSFLAQLIVVLSVIHAFRLFVFLAGLHGAKRQVRLFSEASGIEAVLAASCLLALLILVNHCRKKENGFTPAAWTAIFLCLLGVAPLRSNMKQVAQFFLLIMMCLVFIALFTLMVKGYHYLCTVRIRDTRFWAGCRRELSSDHSSIWFLYIIICLLFLIGTLAVFVKWTGSAGSILEQGDVTKKFLRVAGILIAALLLVLLVLFSLYELGVFLMRTWNEVDTLAAKDKKKYYMAHSLSGFFSVLLTLISWYLMGKISFEENQGMDIFVSMFRYFALPVLLLVWYSVLFAVIHTILLRRNEDSDRIAGLMEQQVYELSGSLINSFTAPFRFVFSYIEMLGEALLEDNSREETEKQQKKKKRKIRAKKKEEVPYLLAVPAITGENREPGSTPEGREIVPVTWRRKEKGGKALEEKE